jgi:hypothetical protein
LICSKIGIDGRLGFDADGTIKIIITVFDRFDQSDDWFVRWIELSAHLLYDHILSNRIFTTYRHICQIDNSFQLNMLSEIVLEY